MLVPRFDDTVNHIGDCISGRLVVYDTEFEDFPFSKEGLSYLEGMDSHVGLSREESRTNPDDMLFLGVKSFSCGRAPDCCGY